MIKPIQIETILHLLKAYANHEVANAVFRDMVKTAYWLGWRQAADELHKLNLPKEQHIPYLEEQLCISQGQNS